MPNISLIFRQPDKEFIKNCILSEIFRTWDRDKDTWGIKINRPLASDHRVQIGCPFILNNFEKKSSQSVNSLRMDTQFHSFLVCFLKKVTKKRSWNVANQISVLLRLVWTRVCLHHKQINVTLRTTYSRDQSCKNEAIFVRLMHRRRIGTSQKSKWFLLKKFIHSFILLGQNTKVVA